MKEETLHTYEDNTFLKNAPCTALSKESSDLALTANSKSSLKQTPTHLKQFIESLSDEEPNQPSLKSKKPSKIVPKVNKQFKMQ